MNPSGPDPLERLRQIDWGPLASVVELVLVAAGNVLGGTAADRVLDRIFRTHRALSAEQRTVIAEAVFGLALWRRRLVAMTRVNAPATLLASFLRDLCAVPPEQVQRLVGVDNFAAWPTHAPSTLGETWSFPEWMAELFIRELGTEEAVALMRALNVPGPVCLRPNGPRITRDALAAELRRAQVETRPGAYARTALIVERGRPNILGLTTHQEGLLEVQDEGSQLLALLLESAPGETVLDFCAGAGGKTLLLASEMADTGVVYAHDVDAEKLERLRHRVSRARLRSVRVLAPGVVPEGIVADAVLVDAPCSSLGALRRGPDSRFRIRQDELRHFPREQQQILSAAARHVRLGGRLVYATCTLNRAENEDVVAAFVAKHPAFSVAPLPRWLDATLERRGFFVSLPHLHGTDGFFGAVLVKQA